MGPISGLLDEFQPMSRVGSPHTTISDLSTMVPRLSTQLTMSQFHTKTNMNQDIAVSTRAWNMSTTRN